MGHCICRNTYNMCLRKDQNITFDQFLTWALSLQKHISMKSCNDVLIISFIILIYGLVCPRNPTNTADYSKSLLLVMIGFFHFLG